MPTTDVEQEVEQRLQAIGEERRRLNFEMSRLRDQMDAADAEDFGLRRFLAVLRGEDPSSVPRRRDVRADLMERDRWMAERRVREERMRIAEEAHRDAVARRAVSSAATTEPPPPQRRLNRADAIEEILNKTDRPLDRREIFSILVAQGREDESLDLVSATLSHLKRSDRIVSTDGGWITPARDAQLREAERAQEKAAEQATPQPEARVEEAGQGAFQAPDALLGGGAPRQ